MAVNKRNGRWQARYRDDSGQQHARMFDRKFDAQRWEADALAKLAKGTWVDPGAGRMTFGAYADEWLATQVLRPLTMAKYEQTLRLHIKPRIGEVPLTAVRRTHIQAMVAWLVGEQKLAPVTVRSAFKLVSTIFKAAVLDRRVGLNPVEGVKLPEVHAERVEIMATEDVVALAEAVPPEWRSAVILCAGTGLRQGELLGLTVDRVNFLKKEIRVDRQLLDVVGQKPHFGPPKTRTSVRTIPMPDVVVQALSAHLAQFPTHADGLIYPPVARSTFSRMWRAAVAGSGIAAGTTVHSLRHYYASLLIRHGESVKTVQERLGHSSASTTLDTYLHLWPDSADRTRSAVDDVLGSASVHSVCTEPPLARERRARSPRRRA